MKIVVAYNWAPDSQEASVDGSGRIDFSRAKPVVSDYDAVAIEVGRQLAEATGASLIGVSVGGPATAVPVATKAALARGLDEVVVVAEPGLATIGTTRTAQVLSAVIAGLDDVALILTGDSSIDVGSKMVGPVLGGLLGYPVLTDVSSVSLAAGSIRAERIMSEGVQATTITGPAVVAVVSDATKPKVPGMKDVLAASKKPVKKLTLAELGLADLDEGTVLSTARLSGPSRKQVVIDVSDPVAAAQELVTVLRVAGVIGGGR